MHSELGELEELPLSSVGMDESMEDANGALPLEACASDLFSDLLTDVPVDLSYKKKQQK